MRVRGAQRKDVGGPAFSQELATMHAAARERSHVWTPRRRPTNSLHTSLSSACLHVPHVDPFVASQVHSLLLACCSALLSLADWLVYNEGGDNNSCNDEATCVGH